MVVNNMYEAIDRVMSEINNKTNMIDEKIHGGNKYSKNSRILCIINDKF